MTANKCFSFPEKDTICEKYIQVSDNKELAKETCDTIKRWLAGKKIKNYRMVPVYASIDYQIKVCSELSHEICVNSMINELSNYKQISNAVDKLAQSCSCD